MRCMWRTPHCSHQLCLDEMLLRGGRKEQEIGMVEEGEGGGRERVWEKETSGTRARREGGCDMLSYMPGN